MPRWTLQEMEQLALIRKTLENEINESPQYPEVIGDRKFIRFLRGHNHNVEKVTELIRKFLLWRKEQNVNEIRRRIIDENLNHPTKFPKAVQILAHMQSVVIAPNARDEYQCPIMVDTYNFVIGKLLEVTNIQEFMIYAVYCLEFRSLVLEQLSEERERDYLSKLSEEERLALDNMENFGYDDIDKAYGHLVFTCAIRDVGGVGFEHLGANSQEIIKKVISLSSDNYPELMRKCYIINTPWLFHTLWYFVKGLLAERTLAKISVLGTNYMEEMSQDIAMENIPSLVGGLYQYSEETDSFLFDLNYLCPVGYIPMTPSSSSAQLVDSEDAATTTGINSTDETSIHNAPGIGEDSKGDVQEDAALASTLEKTEIH